MGIVTASAYSNKESLHYLAWCIEILVFPAFERTRRQKMKITKALQMKEDENSNIAAEPKTEIIQENGVKQEGMLQRENGQKNENSNKSTEGHLIQKNGVKLVNGDTEETLSKAARDQLIQKNSVRRVNGEKDMNLVKSSDGRLMQENAENEEKDEYLDMPYQKQEANKDERKAPEDLVMVLLWQLMGVVVMKGVGGY